VRPMAPPPFKSPCSCDRFIRCLAEDCIPRSACA
jgi:hypothetical protein